jgi:hypothetical protein
LYLFYKDINGTRSISDPSTQFDLLNSYGFTPGIIIKASAITRPAANTDNFLLFGFGQAPAHFNCDPLAAKLPISVLSLVKVKSCRHKQIPSLLQIILDDIDLTDILLLGHQQGRFGLLTASSRYFNSFWIS